MDREEVFRELDAIEQGGSGARASTGETSGQLMRRALPEDPSLARALVDRYASSENKSIVNNLASNLIDLAEHPQPDTVNLIYELAEKGTSLWDMNRAVNNMLIAIRSQIVNGMAWHPPESTPTGLSRFLLHSLGLEPDDENDNADTTVNILWNLHLWAEDRGGLRSVFNAEERQAFRDKFDEVGLDPGPILEALGKD